VLLIFYVLGCRIEGPVTGSVAAALLVFNPIFLISSAIVRPEMLLLLLMGLVFWFIYGTRDTFPWKFYLIGLCSGLAMGIHHNSAPVLLGLLAFQFRIKPGLFRLKPMCSVAAGFLSGMICLLLSFDLFKLYAIQKYFFNEFYSLPLLSFPWHPLAWLYDLGRSFVTGITYYFQTDRPLWQTAIHFWIAGVVLGLAGLFTALMDRHADHDRRALKQALLSGFIITFIAMAAMLRKKEVLYASALFPFIVPGTALFLASLVQVGKKRNTFQKLIGAGACCVILASFLCFLAFVINYTKLYMPYTTMVREVQSKIDHAEEKRVLAPAIFWFGWKSLLFRDLGACFKSHWYTGGGRDLKSWLEPWRPDIIVVDTSLWRHIFLDRKPSSMTMSEALGEPVDYVATVDTGLTSGPLEIYLIHWDHATAS
jgi:thiamine transporter ThiT